MRITVENNALAKLDKATQMLAEAKSLDEVKYIIDIAEAARTYARAAKLGLEAYNHAAEVKARAERKAGEFLKQLERKPGMRTDAQPVDIVSTGSEYKSVLDDNGIGYKAAERWQQVAEMPEDVFEAHLEEMRGERPITTSGIIKELKTEQRLATRAEIARAGADIPQAERWHVEVADLSTWQAPRQYDFIITDPPYPKEFLSLYSLLAIRAKKWLKPGGLLIALSAHYWMNEIYTMLDEHLSYFWTAAYLVPGETAGVFQKHINPQWKPLIMYQLNEAPFRGRGFSDVFKSDANDKNLHKWGQSESGMFDIISKICSPGQYILDPFCGAGTTGVAALKHGCLFDGIDILEENVNLSKGRLHGLA